jgi:hypothetical protein
MSLCSFEYSFIIFFFSGSNIFLVTLFSNSSSLLHAVHVVLLWSNNFIGIFSSFIHLRHSLPDICVSTFKFSSSSVHICAKITYVCSTKHHCFCQTLLLKPFLFFIISSSLSQ